MDLLINRSPDLLHPAFYERVVFLEGAAAAAFEAKKIPHRLELFEGWRSPRRQADLRLRGVTKAGPWESAHQFGLAADFVPRPNGRWSWDGPGCADCFDWLRANVERFGLRNHIAWDRPHVEFPEFDALRNALRIARSLKPRGA